MNTKPIRLSQTTIAFLTIASSLTIVAPVAKAAAYFEDFNTSSGGWFADGLIYKTSGGVGNTGYIQGTRVGNTPNFGEVFDHPNPAIYTLGNLEAVYGHLIDFSYHGKVFQGPVTTLPHQVFFSLGGSTGWIKTVASSIVPFQSDWAPVSFEIDTNWTDAEALADGWTRMSGTTSWSGTLHDVGAQEVFYGFGGVPGQTFITGIDNYRIVGVPEPSSLVLMGLGLAMLPLRRRRV